MEKTMEIAKVELAAIEKTLSAQQFEVKDVRDLSDLELALIGGGCGDISLG
jgi:hypothetical protein